MHVFNDSTEIHVLYQCLPTYDPLLTDASALSYAIVFRFFLLHAVDLLVRGLFGQLDPKNDKQEN